MAHQWDRDTLLELGRAYQRSQPLLTAAELGLFQTLGRRELAAAELAAELGLDARATELLLNALAAQGILDKRRDRFAVVPALASLLDPDDPASVLAMVRHQASCAHRWNGLGRIARGEPAPWDPSGQHWTGEEQLAFIEAMHVVGRELAPALVGDLQPERFRRALDVGGGSGTYTLELLRAAPELRVTLFDLPPVIEMAERRITESGFADRVTLVAGDFYNDTLPAGHDLALLSAIVHQNSPSQNRELFSRCLRALEPGGALVIRDILMDESHTRPLAGALFALNMLGATEGGGTYSLEELRRDLAAAGFEGIELLRRGESMDSLIRSWRSQ